MATTTWNIELDGSAKDMTLTGVTDMAIVILPWPNKYRNEPDITYGTATVGSALADVALGVPVSGVAGKDVTATTLADIRYLAGDSAMGIAPRTHYEPTIGYMFVFTGTVPQPVAPPTNAKVFMAVAATNIFQSVAALPTVPAPTPAAVAHGFSNGDYVGIHAGVYAAGPPATGYPGGITASKVYQVNVISSTEFALLADGKTLDISSNGAGTVALITPVSLPANIANAVFIPMSWGPKLRNTIVP